MDISKALSSITGYGTGSNNSTSALFGSLNANSTKKNNGSLSDLTSSVLGGGTTATVNGVDISNYSAIKNGSYGKLMKKYYSKDVEVSKDDIDAFTSKLDKTSSKAADLASSIDELLDNKYTEDNRENVISDIEDFVSKYNSLLSDVAKSDSKDILQKSVWMTNQTEKFSGLLSNVGISVDSSNKLSVDSDTLKGANMDSLKELFGTDASSFANKTLYKATQIYSLAKTYGTSATAYTSDGAYNRDYSSANYTTTV